MNLLEHAMNGGPIGRCALGLFIVSTMLFLAWACFAVRDRREYPLLGAAAVGLGVLGYIAFDWNHLSLNLSMRDAPSVRRDCVRLLDRRRAMVQKPSEDMHLHGQEMPASFTRLGATYVRVTRSNVQISVIPFDGWGSAWGFLYDPKRSYLTDGWPEGIRSTWYREFYEFRVRGE